MKSEFLTPLRTEKLNDGYYKLIDRLTYHSKLCQEIIIVPMGFVTDFASVPRVPIIYSIFGNIGQKPGTLHDFLYREAWPRKIADRILFEACRASGMGWCKSRGFYTAVRLCGGACYKPFPGVLDTR